MSTKHMKIDNNGDAVNKIICRSIITARKRSLGQGNVFHRLLSFLLSTGMGGGWLSSMHHRSHDQEWVCIGGEGVCMQGEVCMWEGGLHLGEVCMSGGIASGESESGGCASRGSTLGRGGWQTSPVWLQWGGGGRPTRDTWDTIG